MKAFQPQRAVLIPPAFCGIIHQGDKRNLWVGLRAPVWPARSDQSFRKINQEVLKNMARIAGVDLPKEKRVEIGLTYIYGIGRSAATEILNATKINPDTRVKDLTKDEEALIRDYIDKNFIVEGDLRRNTALDIKRLVEIQCYRGIRHRKGLPVRGQRSKTNARTRKGPKRTVANKKK